MSNRQLLIRALPMLLSLAAASASAQNFFVQCPTSTLLHANAATSAQGEPAYTGPFLVNPNTHFSNGVPLTYISNGGTVKCQQISGGDGLMTEADGNQTFMFSFGPLSGLDKIKHGGAGTDFTDEFNMSYCDPSGANTLYNNGQPNPYFNGAADPLNPLSTTPLACGLNGAVGYVPPAAFRTAVAITALASYGPGHTATCTGAPGSIGGPPPGQTGCAISDIIVDANNVPGTIVPSQGSGYSSPPMVTISAPPCTINGTTCVQATAKAVLNNGSVQEVPLTNPGNGYTDTSTITVTFGSTDPNTVPKIDPAAIMNTGVMNGNIPAPEMAFDEDDEFFLTLTNVGMIMRPDLFEQHTVHFHGYPNASSFYDGVPDASVAINIGASFTYYYLAPDAGTYFWHCHITPPEHLQMGMVGQLYVRPRQNRVPGGVDLYNTVTGTGIIGSTTNGAFGTPTGLSQQSDLRTACYSGVRAAGTTAAGPGESNLYAGAAPAGAPSADILCSTPAPVADNLYHHTAGNKYVYNDGDGSTRYDIDVPIQMHGFDPNFHFVGMTFNPEGFADMKDKYFLLNGRSYPDTVDVLAQSVAGWTGGVPSGTANPDVGTTAAPGSNAMLTQGTDGFQRPQQPISTLIVLSQTAGLNGTPQRAALRLVNLSVSEYHTLASLGMPMYVAGYNAKLLRDQAGNNLGFYTNSITLGGGESLDVIIDACAVRVVTSTTAGTTTESCSQLVPQGTYFVYTPNLDHLSNDAENFGGEMTEVVVTP